MNKLGSSPFCTGSLLLSACSSTQNNLPKEHSPEQNSPPKEFLLTEGGIALYKQRALELSQQRWRADCDAILNGKEKYYYKFNNAVVLS